METHDVLARAARELGRLACRARAPRDASTSASSPTRRPIRDAEGIELLVVNTLPWPRTVVVEEPDLRGGGAPVGMLEQFFPRERPVGRRAAARRDAGGCARELPGFGYAFVSPGLAAPSRRPRSGPERASRTRTTASRSTRETGALASWLDKELGHDFAGEHRGWRLGEYVYERVDAATATRSS